MTFFIDGFERIDSEDPNWEIYVASYQAKSSLRVVTFFLFEIASNLALIVHSTP